MSFIVKACWIIFDQNFNQLDPNDYHTLDAANEALVIFNENNTDSTIIASIVYMEEPLFGYCIL